MMSTTILLAAALQKWERYSVHALAAQLRQAVANIRQAAANGDADEVQVLCDALIDVLFEAEE